MSELAEPFERLTTHSLVHRDLGRLGLVNKNGLNERNRFVKKFDWAPHWQAEMSMALKGMPVQLGIIGQMPEPYPAAKGAYNSAIKFWGEAGLAIHHLDQAVINEGEHIPSSELIRESFDVRAAMARHILAHRQLDQSSWHPKARDRMLLEPNKVNDARLLTVTQQLASESNDKLYSGWFFARISESKRFRFWDDELFKVQDNPWVLEIQRRNRERTIAQPWSA